MIYVTRGIWFHCWFCTRLGFILTFITCYICVPILVLLFHVICTVTTKYVSYSEEKNTLPMQNMILQVFHNLISMSDTTLCFCEQIHQIVYFQFWTYLLKCISKLLLLLSVVAKLFYHA